MNIAVCIKQVPDTADLRIDPETNTLIREGVESVMNPLDEFPLEAALRLREALNGTVTAFTMGPPQAAEVLHKAIAMGADKGVLVSDRAFAGADTWATSLTLAKALAAVGPFDLVLCGKQATDGDTAQVGPGIAAHLGIPQVTYVTKIEATEEGQLRLERMLEHGTAVVEVEVPVMLTVLKEANEPRLPTLAGRLRAYKYTPRQLKREDIGVAEDDVGLTGSPTRVVEIAVPQSHRQHRRVQGTPGKCAVEFVRELEERGFIDA
ncbi:MAG: electron transfer flavoprotein subunit beta/FixA family protein [Candidatus Pacebacteria bacterium]|nr:electron transfer flavoprotein subunit beta/FixA family protein [Candidatus Paceibacterota bacterium]